MTTHTVAQRTCPHCQGSGLVSETFADRLKDSREGRALTQAQLAELVGISRPQLANLETGRGDASVPVLIGGPAMMSEPRVYLIRKGGAWYRPNSEGYTSHVAEAGRYTLSEAEDITYPNGPDGPRDGMSFVHERVVMPSGRLEVAGWIVQLLYDSKADRWSGDMFTDILPSDTRTYRIIRPLYAAPPEHAPMPHD